MTSYNVSYYFDQQPGQDSVSGVVTAGSIEAGHAWLIQQLTIGSHERSAGFAEVIDTVDDRTVTHVRGSLSGALAELLSYAQPSGPAAVVSPQLGGAAGC